MHHVEHSAAFDAVIEGVRDRLPRNVRLRRNLPEGGRLRIDRQLPFLCVHRAPPGVEDVQTRELVTTEAAYLFASGDPRLAAEVQRLCRTISDVLVEHFGAFLLIELWAEDDRIALAAGDEVRPGFRIVTPEGDLLPTTAAALEGALREIQIHGLAAEVRTTAAEQVSPPGLPPLGAACSEGCVSIGLAVRPIYHNARTGAVFPVVLHSLRRQLAVALRKAVFAFTGKRGKRRHAHFEALGPSALVKAARLVDQQLCEVAHSFDFVLQTIPVNSASAWEEFRASGYRETPRFFYRPLPYHPSELTRRRFEIPIPRIEDATLIQLFEQKQDHIDRQLTALKHIDTPTFLHDSWQLYGAPSASLVQSASVLLGSIEGGASRRDESDSVHTDEIVAAAREEIDHYHQRLPDFLATVEVRDDIASTLMVAQSNLYVSATAALSRSGLAPVLHHEIGTHLLTYFNGRQQPFQQLCAGLAGYEGLQEGLAVLAEYLTGGLSARRLRTLACRVMAVRSMIEGRPFGETFHLVHEQHRLPAKSAFMTTLRVYRGGGLPKDAIYLGGLCDVLEYLREGHDLEPLYVGKIALEHVPLVQELRRRGIVGPPALLPRFWGDDAVQQRLLRCRRLTLLKLLEDAP
jgi:uncharacterized protein (TIGR02421 family)